MNFLARPVLGLKQCFAVSAKSLPPKYHPEYRSTCFVTNYFLFSCSLLIVTVFMPKP